MSGNPENGQDGKSLETVAGNLLEQGDLCRSVLESLDDEPKGWSELKHLIGDRRDEDLNTSLHFLQDESLIERTTDAREETAIHRYELSPLGEEVLSFLQEHPTWRGGH